MSTKLQELRLTKRLENKIIELADQYQVDTNKVELLPNQALLFGGESTQLAVIHTESEYVIKVIESGEPKGRLTFEKMKGDLARYAIIDLASHLTSLGFRVWVSTGGTCGYSYLIYTDASGGRVVYVHWKLFEGYQVIGNYRPSRKGGKGWLVAETTKLLPKGKWEHFLSASAPSWANSSPVYIGIDEYLSLNKHANYQPASVYLPS